MNSIKYSLLTLLGVAACCGITSCEDKIDLDNRYIPVDNPAPARSVLVEEYTGVDCKNCPNGHARLNQIEQYYNTEANLAEGIGVIAVGIHIPVFGDPVAQGGFVTPEAADLAPGQSTAPAARINRRTEPIELDRWQTAIASEISRKPGVTFGSIKAEITASGLKVSGEAVADEEISGGRLNVWVVEDDITDWQLMPDGEYNSEYVHHAVYRASLTGLRGEEIALTRNVASQFETQALPVASAWNAANLRVVVFIDTDSEGVLNAAQVKVQNL